MATKKKTNPTPVIDMTPSLGDHVSVVTATIFDNAGNLSDVLATGVVTKTDPEPGWDYEVTFDGVLSLDGRGDIKSRLYNKHQITKAIKKSNTPSKISTGMYDVLRSEFLAVDSYNRCVQNIVEVNRELSRTQSPDRLVRLYSERDRYYSMLPDEAKKVKDARKKLADAIRLLLVENPDDKTPVG